MQKTEEYLIGYYPEIKASPAIPEKRDKDGRLIQAARPAIEARPEIPGIKAVIRVPVPPDVTIKSVEFMDGTVAGMIKAGEIIIKAMAVDLPPEIANDGRMYMALCMECSKFCDPHTIKKNSSVQSILRSETEATS